MSNKTPKEDNAKTVLEPKQKPRILLAFIGLAVVALVAAGLYVQQNSGNATVCTRSRLPEKTVITAGTVQLDAELAQDDMQKAQGLSNRNCLDDGTAMLFPYGVPGDYCFWMKDMRFPIDMIWLDDDKKVVTVHVNVQPDSYPQTFCPERPAQYIVEVQAGLASQQDWTRGTQFSF